MPRKIFSRRKKIIPAGGKRDFSVFFYWSVILFFSAAVIFLSFYLYQLKIVISSLSENLRSLNLPLRNSQTCQVSSKSLSAPGIKFSSFLHSYANNLPASTASFTETFSGGGWKDKGKSNVFQGEKTDIISLPPKYLFKEISQPLMNINYNFSGNPGYASQSEISRLEKGAGLKIARARKIGDFWLLAALPQPKGNKYTLDLYAYDGANLQKLAGGNFYSSDYPISPEKIILAGERDDFIAGFYGWESKILRFVKAGGDSVLSPAYEAFDVSYWLETKLAGRIGELKVLKVRGDSPSLGSGAETGAGPTPGAGRGSYLFYSGKEGVFLLVADGLPLDFSSKVFPRKFSRVQIQESKNGFFQIAGFDKNGNGYHLAKLFEFKFLGFDASKKVSFISSNLRSFLPSSESGAEIKSAEILAYLGSQGKGKIDFYFSTDGGKKWLKALPGERIVFKNSPKKNDLRWRVDLGGEKSKISLIESSPFLGLVKIIYQAER